MPNEALTSFTTILEQVPRWIQELEEILETSTRRQEELVTTHQPQHHEPALARRDSLAASAEPIEASGSQPIVAGPVVNDTRPLIPHMTISDALRFSQRKRKTASVCSGDVSGPPKVRLRSRAVVYFDGDPQKGFEQLVRAVGSARNSIRKGKMSARVDSLARTGSSSSESSRSDGEDAWAYASKLKLVHARLPRRSRPFAPDDGAAAFDKVDARLSEAQSLCERAAHQMLRSGNCSLEVGKAKIEMTEAISIIREELPAMRKRAAKAEARERRSEKRHRAEREADSGPSSDDADTSPEQHIVPITASFPAESKLEVDALEVDDSSDDEPDHYNAIPLGKFAQLRSARRAAY